MYDKSCLRIIKYLVHQLCLVWKHGTEGLLLKDTPSNKLFFAEPSKSTKELLWLRNYSLLCCMPEQMWRTRVERYNMLKSAELLPAGTTAQTFTHINCSTRRSSPAKNEKCVLNSLIENSSVNLTDIPQWHPGKRAFMCMYVSRTCWKTQSSNAQGGLSALEKYLWYEKSASLEKCSVE